MEYDQEFERDFMRRTLELVRDYRGPYDATNLLNCLLGLLIVPKEKSLKKIPDEPVAELARWGISPQAIRVLVAPTPTRFERLYGICGMLSLISALLPCIRIESVLASSSTIKAASML